MISRETGVSNEVVLGYCGDVLGRLLASGAKDEAEAELAVWRAMLALAPVLLSALLAARCWEKTIAEIEGRRLSQSDVSFRLEADHWAKLNTSVGDVVFPWFTYRVKNAEGKEGRATRTASRSVAPLHPRTRSSTLLIRLSALVGTHAVFGTAETLLRTITQGAATLEDTTIARHCELVGGLVDRSLMYHSPAEIRDALRDHATRDDLGRPLLNISTDAHNEQLYEGDTWESKYRNIHAVRLWYTDKKTGRGVTVGGEFIVGTSVALIAAFDDLIERGVLPNDGDYGQSVVSQQVFVSDGMPWFQDSIVNKFTGIVVVLDNKHLLKRLLDTLKSIFRKNSPKIQEFYHKLCPWVVGRSPSEKTSSKNRITGPGSRPRRAKGEAINPKPKVRTFPEWDEAALQANGLPTHCGGALLLELSRIPEPKTDEKWKVLEGLLNYVSVRIEHMRYADFYRRNITISSAPIESFHRVAQTRLKLPGVTWSPRMMQSMLNLRVLHFMGNEEKFWAQSGLAVSMRSALDQGLGKRRADREKWTKKEEVTTQPVNDDSEQAVSA